MAQAAPPPTARRYQALSAAASRRAASLATAARPRGARAAAQVLVVHQVAQAVLAERAVSQMLVEQNVDLAAEALLNAPAFTTSVESFTRMADKAATDAEFARLVASLVQDSGRTAQSVAIAARPGAGWVRQLTPPSCSRCVVLAGRVYRYSDGFLRHPGDDCVTVPVVAGDSSLAVDPAELVRTGQVAGLSKADAQAVMDGADLGQVVNVRRKAAGLTDSGTVLTRAGRPTPAAIYRAAPSQDAALASLAEHGYVL